MLRSIVDFQHSVLFKNDSDSEESHKPSTVGTRLSGNKDKHDPASSPESYASAKDGVSKNMILCLRLGETRKFIAQSYIKQSYGK